MLTGVLGYVVGDGVSLVSSAEETAKDVYRELARHDLFRPQHAPAPEHLFLSTGDPEPFGRLAKRFLGPDLGVVARASAAAVGAGKASA
jgi:glutamate racemase